MAVSIVSFAILFLAGTAAAQTASVSAVCTYAESVLLHKCSDKNVDRGIDGHFIKIRVHVRYGETCRQRVTQV